MTVAKVTASSYDNLGRKGTRQDNEMTAIDGLILTTPDFTDTIVNLAKIATWTAGIKAGTVFPLNGLDSYEVQSSDDTIYEAPSGNRKLLKRGKTRYMFNLDIPLDVHKSLQSYNNADLKLWIIRDGKLCFYNPPATVNGQGFSINMINAGRMTEVPADGSTPGFTPLYIDLANYREWDEHGAFLEPSEFEPRDLEPIIDVKVAQLLSPAPSTTVVTAEVYAEDGYDSAGAVKKVYIKGLLAADFDFTKASDGTAQATWTLGDVNGVYTFTTASTFVAGKLTILPTSVTSGIIVKHADAAIDIAVS